MRGEQTERSDRDRPDRSADRPLTGGSASRREWTQSQRGERGARHLRGRGAHPRGHGHGHCAPASSFAHLRSNSSVTQHNYDSFTIIIMPAEVEAAVSEGLWLGTSASSGDATGLKAAGVTHVLSLMEQQGPLPPEVSSSACLPPPQNGKADELVAWLERCASWITGAHSAGGRVLVCATRTASRGGSGGVVRNLTWASMSQP